MTLGLPEIAIILAIIVVLFGVTWVIRDRRSKKAAKSGVSTEKKQI